MPDCLLSELHTKYSSSDFIWTHHPNHSSALKVPCAGAHVQQQAYPRIHLQHAGKNVQVCSSSGSRMVPSVGFCNVLLDAADRWRALLAAGCSLGAPVQNAAWAQSWLCLRVLQGRLSACKHSCTEFSTFLSYPRMNLLNPMQFCCGLHYTYSRPVPHENVFLTCSCYTHEERKCISSLFFPCFHQHFPWQASSEADPAAPRHQGSHYNWKAKTRRSSSTWSIVFLEIPLRNWQLL